MNKFSLSMLILFFLLNSCLHPPVETGKLSPDLVEIKLLDTSIHLDIKYATANNLTGKPVYTQAKAFLQRPAAEALVKAHEQLKLEGFGLLIFDGYRPWTVTKKFWQTTSHSNKKFVADPRKGSRHNRGCAVDLSMYSLANGNEVSMPGVYDEMSERSYPDYNGGTDEQRKNRDLLRSVMEKNGFKVYDYEWWHFDYKDWRLYAVSDIPFESINEISGN